MILAFSLFAIARAVLTTTHNISGANGNVHHCHDIRDAHNLIVLPELPRAHNIYFELDSALKIGPHTLRSSLLHSKIVYSFEVPYLAYDCRYRVWLESKSDENNNTCSTEIVSHFDKPLKSDKLRVADVNNVQSDWSDAGSRLPPPPPSESAANRTWLHAPNAGFPRALGNSKYGAYYIDPASIWSVHASDKFPCSQVKFVAEATFDELRACEALAVTSLANDTVRVASHTLVITLATPDNEKYGENRVQVHLFAYNNDNFMRIVLLNGVSLNSQTVVSSAILRNMRIAEEAQDRLMFRIVLRATTELHRSMVSLHSLNNAGIELIEMLLVEEQPNHAFLYHLDFASNETVGVIDEKLTLDIRVSHHVHHTDICSVVIDVLVTNPRSIETSSTGDLKPMLTNHVVLYNGHDIVERDAKIVDGSQVCMINNVVMPADMAAIVAIRIAEAWLCVIPKALAAETGERMHCSSQRHTIELFRNGKPNADLNVSIVSPGRLGPTSVELCFSTSFEITDNDFLTLQAPVQRYESRIELVPRTTLHGEPSLFESLEGEEEFGSINDRLRNHSSQERAYSQYHIQRALRKVGHQNAEFHVRSIEFGVAPTLGTTHNMPPFVSNVILLMVFFMFFCVVAAYFFLSAFEWRNVFRPTSFVSYYKK